MAMRRNPIFGEGEKKLEMGNDGSGKGKIPTHLQHNYYQGVDVSKGIGEGYSGSSKKQRRIKI